MFFTAFGLFEKCQNETRVYIIPKLPERFMRFLVNRMVIFCCLILRHLGLFFENTKPKQNVLGCLHFTNVRKSERRITLINFFSSQKSGLWKHKIKTKWSRVVYIKKRVRKSAEIYLFLPFQFLFDRNDGFFVNKLQFEF